MNEGVVTVMFTDVEGSTDVTRRLGDEEGRRVLEAYKRLVREEVERHSGREIDSIGDGFFITFSSTRRAVTCAVEIQKALDRQGDEQPEEPVRVRIGLNVGEVIEREGHPFGAAVNATQRVAAHAKGGQILVSEPVRHLAGTIPGVSFRDRGRREVKGFAERWRLYEVVWERAAKPAPPRAKAATRPRWRRLALAVGGIALAAIVAAVLTLLLTGGGTKLSRIDADSVGLLDAKSGKIVGEVRVGARPAAIAYGAGALWVANAEGRTVSRIDPDTRTETTEIGGVGRASPSGIAAGGGAVWLTSPFANRVVLIDAHMNTVTGSIPLPVGSGPAAVAVGNGYVWLAESESDSVTRLDPETKHVHSERVGREPSAIAFGEDGVWVANSLSNSISRLNPNTGVVSRRIALRPGHPPTAIAVGDGAVWVVSTEGDSVTRIDPQSNTAVITIPVGNAPVGVAAGEGGVWVTNSLDRSVWRIDPSTNGVVEKIPVGSSPDAIVVTDRQVWVTAHAL
jgi:YVTN family beta-propeller protein